MRLQTEDGEDHECAGEAVSSLTSTYEIEVDILEEVLHQRGGEAQLLSIVFLAVVLQQEAGDEHSREEGGDDTDHVGNSEALDRTGTEDSQDSTGEERSHVRIHNRGDGTLETVLDSLTHTFTCAELLTDTLVDKHVRIDCTTHGEDDTGNTRQRQYCAERRENTYQQEYVANQRCVGNQTRDPTVVEDHIDQDKAETENEGPETRLNSLTTQRRTYHTLLDDTSRSRHLTGLQGVSQVFCLFYSEVTGDLAVTTCDLILYGREGINISVEYDSYRFTDVVFGQTLPSLSTLSVHGHRHVCICADLREVCASIGDHVTFERSATVTLSLEGYELIVCVCLIDRFYSPVETCVTRQNSFSDLRVEHCVYFSGIYIVNGTYYRTTISLTGLVDRRVEDSEERVVLLVLSYLCSLISLSSCGRVA